MDKCLYSVQHLSLPWQVLLFELMHNEDQKTVFYFLQRTESCSKLESQGRGVCMCTTIYILYIGRDTYNIYSYRIFLFLTSEYLV